MAKHLTVGAAQTDGFVETVRVSNLVALSQYAGLYHKLVHG